MRPVPMNVGLRKVESVCCKAKQYLGCSVGVSHDADYLKQLLLCCRFGVVLFVTAGEEGSGISMEPSYQIHCSRVVLASGSSGPVITADRRKFV
jgi:ribosomal protein S6E (S10)